MDHCVGNNKNISLYHIDILNNNFCINEKATNAKEFKELEIKTNRESAINYRFT